ncbi:MAG: hypothetical protein HKO98_05265, partial [Gemmatimonadetes bacterium]|nr:hypothetical protein [Gemmatimonadota bacterium]
PAQAERVLDGMARDWTEPRLDTLVRVEFEDPDALDRWVDDPRAPEGRRLRAFPLAPGPGLHICAGSVPGVSVSSAIRGLIVGSPVLLKPGGGDRVLPAALIDILEEEGEVETAARILADAVECVEWTGGAGSLDETEALDGAAFVVVYGGGATIEAVRRAVAGSTPVVEYGHRMGVAVVGRGADLDTAAKALAAAVAVFDQRGCVSPQQVFTLGPLGGTERAAELAARSSEALAALEGSFPSGPLDEGLAGAVRQLRDATELRALAGDGAQVWGGDDLEWTVVLDPEPELRPSCGGRTIHVTPVGSEADLERILLPLGPHMQTVGVDGFDAGAAQGLAERLARIGASRVVPLDRIAFPPPWWIHDGQGPLRRLVRWSADGPV